MLRYTEPQLIDSILFPRVPVLANEELIVASFTRDASFLHPIVNVRSGLNSRETIKNVYAVYKVLTRNVVIDFQSMKPTAFVAGFQLIEIGQVLPSTQTTSVQWSRWRSQCPLTRFHS